MRLKYAIKNAIIKVGDVVNIIILLIGNSKLQLFYNVIGDTNEREYKTIYKRLTGTQDY